ncbi:hypothetical protein LAZ67_1007156, partial [Cordylochernes scorpioides]
MGLFFYPQTKKQSLEWHIPSSPRKKKVRLDKSKGKVMFVVFFDYQGLVYYKFIKDGVTINKQAYKEILVSCRILLTLLISAHQLLKEVELLKRNLAEKERLLEQWEKQKKKNAVLESRKPTEVRSLDHSGDDAERSQKHKEHILSPSPSQEETSGHDHEVPTECLEVIAPTQYSKKNRGDKPSKSSFVKEVADLQQSLPLKESISSQKGTQSLRKGKLRALTNTDTLVLSNATTPAKFPKKSQPSKQPTDLSVSATTQDHFNKYPKTSKGQSIDTQVIPSSFTDFVTPGEGRKRKRAYRNLKLTSTPTSTQKRRSEENQSIKETKRPAVQQPTKETSEDEPSLSQDIFSDSDTELVQPSEISSSCGNSLVVARRWCSPQAVRGLEVVGQQWLVVETDRQVSVWREGRTVWSLPLSACPQLASDGARLRMAMVTSKSHLSFHLLHGPSSTWHPPHPGEELWVVAIPGTLDHVSCVRQKDCWHLWLHSWQGVATHLGTLGARPVLVGMEGPGLVALLPGDTLEFWKEREEVCMGPGDIKLGAAWWVLGVNLKIRKHGIATCYVMSRNLVLKKKVASCQLEGELELRDLLWCSPTAQ